MIAIERHSLRVDSVLQAKQGSRVTAPFCHLLSSGDLGEHFGSASYPEKAVRVLGEDRVPPLVRVGVRHRFDARPQQLVPQQGSVGHSI